MINLEKSNHLFKDRIDQLVMDRPIDHGFAIRSKIQRLRGKHLLIHSFSHLLMRELEFSCGYPTASLKERLYISDRMAGLLIYTAEGSEGSMGGLIWQSRKRKTLKSSLKRP